MADKELFRVRKEFVEGVTDELLRQLLDDLLGDGVFNQGQKDWILERNPTTTNKARDLIDTVMKKGDKASRKMIAHLQSRDPELYSKLGLTCGEPAQPEPQMKAAGPQMKAAESQMKAAGPQMKAAGPQMNREWSTVLLPTPKEFWEMKLNDSHVYAAAEKSIRNRKALLITNIKFTDETSNRNGAEKDEENMEKLLTGLGYEVFKFTNLTGKQIDDTVIWFSKHPKLRETDSVVVVIMSHGKLGTILGVDWTKEKSDDVFPIKNLYEHLGTENCPALLHKPKIIIIQACRKEDKGPVLVKDGAEQDVACDDALQPDDMDDIEEDAFPFAIKEKDFMPLLSCTPDTVSYRHTVHGSFLIQYIVDVFFTLAREEHIEELFRIVMLRFEDFSVRQTGGQKGGQMPTKDRCTLTKKFYFFPGI
ncbi:caspase-1-like isoform X2 [Sebastes umbrosus]|uniref:caspase-1-like isoform X2 n=1 Tax=Sebastes umbrosus TaxID=72105 RepID=UPI00189C931D|nr:caspase-1-like isoform X2 [Sebastes umbrosus]